MSDTSRNTADVIHRRFFLISVIRGTLDDAVPVDLMPVEFWAVHAGELGLAADRQAAAAAHTSPINHDGVHGHDGPDAIGPCGLGHALHHDVGLIDGSYAAMDDLYADFTVGQLFQGCLYGFRAPLYIGLYDNVEIFHFALLDPCKKIIQRDLLRRGGASHLFFLLTLLHKLAGHAGNRCWSGVRNCTVRADIR